MWTVVAFIITTTVGALSVWADKPTVTVAPAFAAKPDSVVVDVDETEETFVGACDFPVQHNIKGFIRFTTYLNQDSSFKMQINSYHLTSTFINLETGASVSTPNVGPDKITVTEDGSVILAATGLIARIVVPGKGLIVAQVGKLVFRFTVDQEGNWIFQEVLFEAGQHADLFPALCSVLD
jgi:hypothetical protein